MQATAKVLNARITDGVGKLILEVVPNIYGVEVEFATRMARTPVAAPMACSHGVPRGCLDGLCKVRLRL